MGRPITHDIDSVGMRSDAFAGERSRPRSAVAVGLHGAPNRASDKPAAVPTCAWCPYIRARRPVWAGHDRLWKPLTRTYVRAGDGNRTRIACLEG